jgi:hypothetical protein
MSSRVITFSDGFTAASAPTGSSGGVESYLITNNATAGVISTLAQVDGKSVFADYEIRRETSLGVFIQSGSIIFAYDGAWSLSFGNYMGDEIFVDTIANTEHVKLMINSATGAITYDSGNMSGTGYTGTFKLNIVRVQ